MLTLLSAQLTQFCTGGCEERLCTCEAEESPLLEGLAWKRLVKIQQGGKSLEDAVVICELWRLVMPV
jgi:hypothetical protein